MNKHQTHTDPNQAGGEQKRKIDGKVHVSGEIEIHVPPDVHKQQTAADNKKDAREKRKEVIDGVTLFFVVIVAGLSAVQTRQSIRSADAAKTAADAANDSLVLTRAQILPSIHPISINVREEILPNKLTKIQNAFKNTGNTTAYDVQSFATSQSIITGNQPVFEFKQFIQSKGTIGAGDTFDSPLFLPSLNEVQIEQVMRNERKLYITGLIMYRDITHVTHHTYYCFVFEPATGNGNGSQETKESD